MPPAHAYRQAAQVYAAGVGSFFTPAAPTDRERGLARSAAPTLVEQAEALAPASAALLEAAEAQLADPDPAVRAATASQLLAKALTDLEIGAALLQAAEDEGAGPADIFSAERSSAGAPAALDLQERLAIVLAEDQTQPVGERSLRAARPSTPEALHEAVADTLLLIKDRAGQTGQTALAGLLALGAGELAQAAGGVGMDIARFVGQAENVTRIYNACRAFIVQAYNSVLALLGHKLAQAASGQVLTWIDEVRGGARFADLVDRLYQTGQTAEALRLVVAGSQAPPDAFAAAINGVDDLGATYGRQVGLADKLLKGLRLFGGIPAAVLPQARLLFAAAYIVVCAYVVLAGADFVDAQRARLLDRTPGVRSIVETHLTVA